MLEPARAGLTNDREAECLDARQRTPPGRCSPLGPGDDDAGGDRQAGGLQDDLHEGLVHADRRGQHAGADVAHAGHLQQALEGAVLAPRAVQQREHHVDLADDRRHAAPARSTTRSVPVVGAHQRDRRPVAVDLRAGRRRGSRAGCGSSASSTHRPSGAIPTGTTSYFSRSIAASTLPAVTHEMACSLERPPKTTATRGLRLGSLEVVSTRSAYGPVRRRRARAHPYAGTHRVPPARHHRRHGRSARRTSPTRRSTRRSRWPRRTSPAARSSTAATATRPGRPSRTRSAPSRAGAA